ncbi:TetR/AcrR family transcriptional repressor of uid operon [Microbacterium paludicola]|uniref:TetR/AcrR family transcriptional repressor of uid operon n=1 Tax=Microbacterium paludicola TaxID=300019 RepID=A0ABU1HW63_9MICO|nr:ScbR family autoregulator-binding transcription factor [Microbacterium paludicola]MDR6165880.1 TetR/AcrR family transcriptional repressor of uid operon [Microbacterium paludicola]
MRKDEANREVSTAVRRTPQQSRSQETQRAVVEGAANVFDREGYGKASLSMIVEESGISQGSMYFHFKSKEQIALAVINEQHARSLPLLTDAVDTSPGVFDRLVSVSRAMADQLRHDAVVRAGIRLAMEEGALGAPAGNFYLNWVEMTSAMLAPALERGELTSGLSPETLAKTLIGFFTGVQLMSQAMSSRDDLLAGLRDMWLFAVDAMVPPADRDAAVAAVEAAFRPA